MVKQISNTHRFGKFQLANDLCQKKTMRYSILIITCLFFIACSKPEPPVFLRMENVEVLDIRKSRVYVTANAVFNNPNPISGNLVGTDLKVIVNEVDMGTVGLDTTTVIPVKSDFLVPINVDFPVNKVFENQKGLLKGVLNALIDKKAKVQFKGTITLDFLKVQFDVPVDDEGELVIK